MKKLNRQNFEPALKKYETRDPELHKELVAKLSGDVDERVERVSRSLEITAEVAEMTSDAGAPTEEGERVLETIVQTEGRPVLTIANNQATTRFLGAESRVWAARIDRAKNVLDKVIPAVGRVEVSNHPNALWLGTGWLVADDIIVTNRHVAVEFCRRANAGFSFRTGINGGPIAARIDFLEEYLRPSSLEFAVVSILWIAKSDELDVAFLRVKRAVRDRPLPKPLKLAESIPKDDFVATIGYPARDERIPDQALVRRIFGDIYDKKRLAPGQIDDVQDDELEHDCSTLGGNSGSALVSLRTGEAVGLHFAGLFMKSNFAVPAPKIQEYLRRVQKGEFAQAPVIAHDTQPTRIQSAIAPMGIPMNSAGSYTLQFHIPVEITVKVGNAVLPGAGLSTPIASSMASSIASNQDALRIAQESLATNPNVIEVRLGYRFKGGWITDERVIVVEVKRKLPLSELQGAGMPVIPREFGGLGVDVRTAALPDQLESLGVDMSFLEAPAHAGQYREPPNLKLEAINENVEAIFHVSPDSGFPNLKRFFGRVKNHLTATMYEWESEHISAAIKSAMTGTGRSLRMVTQRRGTAEAVEEMQGLLGAKFKHVWASVGAGKLIPSAYHIKVASRDGEEFWLSSGNWKNSNQNNIDPAGANSTAITPLRQHNREWHAIVKHAKLAKLFQSFIEFDFKEAQRVPLEEGLDLQLPELFVPDAAFLDVVEPEGRAKYFDPLKINRKLEIQPLLTPDRNSRGKRLFMKFALEMIKKGNERIYVQNQSFNLLDENNDEFEMFFSVLRDKQQAGVDVRIIFRDGREFGAANAPKQQKLLERLSDFGFDMDFVKVQMRCHTKGIIVDTKEVMLGSHNLTNEGSLFNRDASLLVRDVEVAKYFEDIFLFDWEVLAAQQVDELVGGVSLATPGEPTPPGFRRVNLSEFLFEG